MSSDGEKVVSWRTLSQDPNADVVKQHIGRELASRYRGRIADSADFLERFVSGRTVLDVGVVQHSIERSKEPGWKHAKIVKSAARTVGVDILEHEVRELVRRGYDVRCVDATSDGDLGVRFDRVVLGDVIEHVDSPVALLRFARRHLVPGGLILCNTPNPMFVPYVAKALRSRFYVPNAEHVAWLVPSHALELAARAGVELFEYRHISGNGTTPARRVLSRALEMVRVRESELFAGGFSFVFRALPA